MIVKEHKEKSCAFAYMGARARAWRISWPATRDPNTGYLRVCQRDRQRKRKVEL